MNDFSLIFVRDAKSQVSQYTLSGRLVTGIIFTLVASLIAITTIYYLQLNKIGEQRQTISEQKETQLRLQAEIDQFSDKEQRIAFLEGYVRDLKQTTANSENLLKQYIELARHNTMKLGEVHQEICQSLQVDCVEPLENPNDPDEIVVWMSQVQSTMPLLSEAVFDFNERRSGLEEKQVQLLALQDKVEQTQSRLKEHLSLIHSKEDSIGKLTAQIQDIIGIEIDLDQELQSIQGSSTESGRGGPTLSERMLLEEESGEERQPLELYLSKSSLRYNAIMESFEELTQALEEDRMYWEQTPTVVPVPTLSISDNYGRRIDPFTKKWDFHAGTDFIAVRGTPIYAPANGVVKRAEYRGGYGRFIEIDHGPGFYYTKDGRKQVVYSSRYGHLDKILVKRGQQVTRGEEIGKVGNTGRSTGPHLHYEVLINGKHLDPMRIIKHFNPVDQKRFVLK